jgi:hypothetical protein
VQETPGSGIVFKWLKQHLPVKSFLGDNPECCQNPNLLCGRCLLFGCHRRLQTENGPFNLRIENPQSEILQIPGISLPDKTPVREILTKCENKNVKELKNKQSVGFKYPRMNRTDYCPEYTCGNLLLWRQVFLCDVSGRIF